jgi:hypothetical protein
MRLAPRAGASRVVDTPVGDEACGWQPGNAATRLAYFFLAAERLRAAGFRDFAAAAFIGRRAVFLAAVLFAALLRAVFFAAGFLAAAFFAVALFAGFLAAGFFADTAILSLPPVFLDCRAPTVRSNHSCYRSSRSGNTSPTES